VSDVEELRARVAQTRWYHSIDLGSGVVTPGASVNTFLDPAQLPDLRGKSVLDIGAWDGFYSFMAEQNGAARVVALDHYAWGVDFEARDKYWAECEAKGVLPDHALDTTEFWRDDLPGRKGFELAHEALGSKVEPVVGDFMTMDLEPLGTFDVVLYLGVLYHMREPMHSLDRVRALTNGVAAIETEAIFVEGLEGLSLTTFNAGGEISADYGNWYVPTLAALRAWCRAAQFSRVETVVGPPPRPVPEANVTNGKAEKPIAKYSGKAYRAFVRARDAALKGTPAAPQDVRHYRAVVHAYV
jgi:tRNA (mo5U34)-methyltransferase